ncbi:MAG: hypothetical protein AMJ79_08105 [Phycisphaerae bacterium SM23_30]|nr:MAG: hypothetical protein AMJ79_08105 [Phycisphaerae bacterium SM23_30]
MTKADLDPFAYLSEFYKLLSSPGALLVTQGWEDRPNVMAIGWAHIGIVWSKPVCIVYVRPSRHSYTCLEQQRQFTVNTVTRDMAEMVELCGTVSGRERDKFTAAKLSAVPSKKVKPPVIEQGILHYECRVVHYSEVQPANLHREIIVSRYAEGDFHRVYYGEIAACYGDGEALQRI